METIEEGDIVFVEWHYQDMMDLYEVNSATPDSVTIVDEYNRDYGDAKSLLTVPITKCRLVCKCKARLDKERIFREVN